MFTFENGLTVAASVAVALVGYALLRFEGDGDSGFDRWLRESVRAAAFRRVLERIDWRVITLTIALTYAAVAAFDLSTGAYACSASGQTADPVALLVSGEAFRSGGNPFLVSDCGATTGIPYGLAAVLVDALGSYGGLAGISAAWGVFAVALVPLTWFAARPPERRFVTLFVALLPIYFPLVASQIDGASNAIVPVAVLLTILLARRGGVLAGAVGGFLATARFPTLFPVLASRGNERRWFLQGVVPLASFGAFTAASYRIWGHAFFDTVFTGQVNRRSFSLNLYGVPLDHNALPTSEAIVVVQAVLIVAVTAAAFFAIRSPLRAAALALVGFALLTPFLSYSILVGLVPVALVGRKERRWLWAVGLVGSLNYSLGLGLVGPATGNFVLSDVLDVLLTGLLVGLLVDLWRGRRTEELAPPPARPAPEGGAATPG